MRRVYWEDAETGRRGFSDGELPDGPLVEEISAYDFYTREALSLACGWPAKHHPAGEGICPCGCIFPDRASSFMHVVADEATIELLDDEVLG